MLFPLRVECLPQVLEFIAGIKTAANLLQEPSSTGIRIVIFGWVSAYFLSALSHHNYLYNINFINSKLDHSKDKP